MELNRFREAQKGRQVSAQGRSPSTPGGGSQISGQSGSYAPLNYCGKKRKFYKNDSQGQSQQQSSVLSGLKHLGLKGDVLSVDRKDT